MAYVDRLLADWMGTEGDVRRRREALNSAAAALGHVTRLELIDRETHYWRWVCSCGMKSTGRARNKRQLQEDSREHKRTAIIYG